MKILLSSFTVVLVGFMEAYAISKKYATKMDYGINVNQVSVRGDGAVQVLLPFFKRFLHFKAQNSDGLIFKFFKKLGIISSIRS